MFTLTNQSVPDPNPKPPNPQINPQHTIPTLDDNGSYLWESTAICTYLIGKYGPRNGCALYPNEPLKRAYIDQRLYFNAAILFPLLRTSGIQVIVMGKPAVGPRTLKAVAAALDILEQFQASQPAGTFLVGDQFTLADLATATTVTSMEQWFPLPVDRYGRTAAWLKRVADAVPFYDELNTSIVNAYGQIFAAKLLENGQLAVKSAL